MSTNYRVINILHKIVFISALLVSSFASADQNKVPSQTRSDEAIHASSFFWEALNNGLYFLIPDVLNALTGAYLNDKNDTTTAAHIGAAHAWRLSERERMNPIPSTITDDATLARKYFEEKMRMEPTDAHFMGFLGSFMMSEADVHGDEKLMKKGYKTLLSSTKLFPEFNYVTGALAITGGVIESPFSVDSDIFKLALEWQWETINLCYGQVDRSNPDVSMYLSKEIHTGPKKVCWNSATAPHKFEGFFLNMGDMLVKSGDWKTAQKIYANARLSSSYSIWQYAGILEQRIIEAETNVALFNAPRQPSGHYIKPMISQSAYSCTACHQN